jgi:hypothetical protein
MSGDGDKKCCSQPVSRILSPSTRRFRASLRATTIPLAPALLTGSSNLPGSCRRAACSRKLRGASLFGLAPCGVLPATSVARSAVRSYRTFSPLPFDSALSRLAQGGIFSVPLVRRVAPPGNYPAHCPVEFGLSSPESTFTAHTVVTLGNGHPANCNSTLSHGKTN